MASIVLITENIIKNMFQRGETVNHPKHLHSNIQISSDKICRKGAASCANNATATCYSSAIFSGNPHVPIKFTAAPIAPIPKLVQPAQKAPIQEFNAKKLVLPKMPETKVLIEDDADMPNKACFNSDNSSTFREVKIAYTLHHK
jgi:hypothetical protein